MDPKAEIARLEQVIENLRRQLTTDELTEILNRRGLMEFLKPLAGEVSYQLKNPEKRKSVIIRSFSLAFVDIDHFKKINDTYGHAAGDLALRVVANVLRKHVRGIDVVGRYGGEEILVGLVGANAEEAERVTEQLRQKVEETEISFEDKKFNVTASFGVAALDSEMTLEQLIDAADKALYEAKNTGRNKVVVNSN